MPQIPLSSLLQAYITQTLSDLSQDPIVTHTSYAQAAKLLSLTRCMRLIPLGWDRASEWITAKDVLYERAANDLYHLAAELKLPLYDIPTAIDVLTTGKMALPEIIQTSLLPPKTLSDQATAQTQEALNQLLQMRLLTQEYIPPQMRSNMIIDQGFVVFNVTETFQVKLTLSSLQGPWKMIEIKSLVQTRTQGYQGACCSGAQSVGLVNPLSESMLQTIATGVQQRLEKTKSSALVALFEYLNKMGVQLQLETLLAQAEFLSKTRWKSALHIDSSTSSNLRIYYWQTKNSKKRFLEFRMDQKVVSEWDMDRALVPNPLPGALNYHTLSLGSFFEINGVLTESFGPSLTMISGAMDLEACLLQVTQSESQSLLDRLCDSLEAHSCFQPQKLADALMIEYTNGYSLRVFIDPISGRIQACPLEGQTVSPALTVFQDRVNSDLDTFVSALLFVHYENLLESIKSMALNAGLVPLASLNMDRKALDILYKQIPPNQTHVMFLSFKEFQAQYVALAVAGARDWDRDFVTSDSIQDFPQSRLWMISTIPCERTKTLLLNGCLALEPFHILSESNPKLVTSYAGLSMEILSQISLIVQKQLNYRSFVMEVQHSRQTFKYLVDPTLNRATQLSEIPLVTNLLNQPKLVLSLDSIHSLLSSHLFSPLYLYIVESQDDSEKTKYSVNGKIRIRGYKLPPFKVLEDHPRWTYQASSGCLEFKYEGISGFMQPLLDFLAPAFKLSHLAYQVHKKKELLLQSRVQMLSFDLFSLSLKICGLVFQVRYLSKTNKEGKNTLSVSCVTQEWFEKRIIRTVIGFAAKSLSNDLNLFSICMVKFSRVHLQKLSGFLQLLDAVGEINSQFAGSPLYQQTGLPAPLQLIPHSLDQHRVFIYSRFALDVHFLSSRAAFFHDAYHSLSYGSVDTKMSKSANPPGTKENFKLEPIPGWSLMDTSGIPEYDSSNDDGFAMLISNGILASMERLAVLLEKLNDHIEKLTLLKWLENRLLKVKAQKLVENVIAEESNVRIMWTTDTVKAALSIKPDKSWQVLMVPHKAELMTQYQLIAADSKPLSELLSIKMNECSKHVDMLGVAQVLVQFSLLPMVVIRDFVQFSKWELTPTGASLSTQWMMRISGNTILSYLPRDRHICFEIDLKQHCINFVIKFFTASNESEHVLIPIRYNYMTGVINLWKSTPDPDDMTPYAKTDPALTERLKKATSSKYLNSLTFVERVLAQATSKDVPIHLGGPGKLFVVVKHLSSRPLTDLLQSFV